MSGGRERDSGVHDRTINKTSSEEDKEVAHNPLGVIAEGNEGNAEAINPIQVAGNPNPNPENSDDNNDMANNAVKPGQLTALPTFDGERGEGFTNWLECLENANDTYQWPPNSLIQVVKAKGGPRVAEWDRGKRLRGRNPPVWAGDAGYRAALILQFGPECKSSPLSYANSGDIFIYNSNLNSETSQLFIPIFKAKPKVMTHLLETEESFQNVEGESSLSPSRPATRMDAQAKKGHASSGYLPEEDWARLKHPDYKKLTQAQEGWLSSRKWNCKQPGKQDPSLKHNHYN